MLCWTGGPWGLVADNQGGADTLPLQAVVVGGVGLIDSCPIFGVLWTGGGGPPSIRPTGSVHLLGQELVAPRVRPYLGAGLGQHLQRRLAILVLQQMTFTRFILFFTVQVTMLVKGGLDS